MKMGIYEYIMGGAILWTLFSSVVYFGYLQGKITASNFKYLFPCGIVGWIAICLSPSMTLLHVGRTIILLIE